MALAKKGSRSVVVDGVGYRWAVTDRLDLDPGFVAEFAERPGCRLIWTVSDGVGAPVTPGRVAVAIRRARTMGWDPYRAGAEFRVVNGRPYRPGPAGSV